MRKAALALLLLPAALSGCGSSAAAARNTAFTASALAAPAHATATLGIEMLRRLPPGNLVFSPDSVAATVAMAGEGARGATAEQIVRTLHAGSQAALASFGALQARILAEQAAASRGAREPEKLSFADALFVQQSLPLRQQFVGALQSSFGAAPVSVDFENGLPAAERTINEWVSARTGGVIPSIVAELPRETKLALANAVYLQALWPGKLEQAGERPFYAPSGHARVPMMGETSDFPYALGPGFQAVSLPYAHSTLSLLIVLPDRGGADGLQTLQRTLSAQALSTAAARMRRRAVSLELPRFHIAQHVELSPLLAGLGMPRAFSETAEFPGITSAEALKIDKVLHAADIRVNERGTTAAAATVLTATPLDAIIYRHVVRFDADHPFLFFLRDNDTGAVLFAGRVVDAAAAPTPGVSPNAKL